MPLPLFPVLFAPAKRPEIAASILFTGPPWPARVLLPATLRKPRRGQASVSQQIYRYRANSVHPCTEIRIGVTQEHLQSKAGLESVSCVCFIIRSSQRSELIRHCASTNAQGAPPGRPNLNSSEKCTRLGPALTLPHPGTQPPILLDPKPCR